MFQIEISALIFADPHSPVIAPSPPQKIEQSSTLLLRDAAGGTGDAPVTEWMKVLFRERSWGDMAASETFAHLEHLRLAGEAVTHRDDDGLLYFELSDAG